MNVSNVRAHGKATLALPVGSTVALCLGIGGATIGVNVAGTYAVTAIFVCIAIALTLARHGISAVIRNWRRIDFLAVAFLGWITLIEMYNAATLRHTPNMGSIALWALAYLSSWPARLTVADERGFIRFAMFFCIPSVLVAAIAIAQMLRLPGVNELMLQVVRTSGLEQRLAISREIRATSLIGHQIGLGAYLCAVLALLGGALILGRQQRVKTIRTAAMWVTAFVGQLATVTFATTALSLAIGLAIAAKVRVRLWMVTTALVGIALGWQVFGAFIAQRVDQQAAGSFDSVSQYAWLPETLGFRVSKWITETIPAAMHRPMSGWGYGVYESAENGWPVSPSELSWMSPESEWLRTLISAGAPGLLLEVLLLLAMLGSVSAKGPSSAHLFPLKVFIAGLLIACFIHSHLTGPGVIVALWAIVGAAWGSQRPQ
ncbi:hypothetical protein [Stenotrophomonas sp. CFBP8980]|uniref:O-antigen ligase family protein n=1 Tax=Stenotrophomonas sp. CFBP8980 TaxID=3096523 RepID=UPI002A6A0AB7|nr:hypothetical protein [Stenotrophomonas sp. CFBP8980]MDY1034249.1 hypothetical protein [Stenotrophomonas sp. CFBP8980]